MDLRHRYLYRCRGRDIGVYLFKAPGHDVFRRGAPFRRTISFLKQRLIEAGLIDHWTDGAVAAATETEIEERGGRTLQISGQMSLRDLSVTELLHQY
ncbi:hypothetical protein E2C01_053108 [Portunus trituberculatus]|uniref:Uncharacterized protein n=1 Tax=Portunus trituberculatus TaxID=210409 RepID=A0A5B7GNF8_PORTR|nr:hypothetical protein [Portunus trituberculatus]